LQTGESVGGVNSARCRSCLSR